MGGGISILLFIVSFCASVVGAICGIGGGVIIKPILDTTGVMDVAAISFLSGCTVLAMSMYTIGGALIRKETRVDLRIGIQLSVGGVMGGIAGKQIFSGLWLLFDNKNLPGLIQTACVIILIAGAFLYMLRKKHIRTHRIQQPAAVLAIGFTLGIFSSFLGIGGGPINLVVMFYCFSMQTKEATENSLFVILFSQLASLLTSVITQTVPEVGALPLALMMTGGIIGGVIGKQINKRIDGKTVETMFMTAMAIILMISVWNLLRFTGIPA